MIVIKATGKTDVRALRKLASQLSADEVEVAPQEIQPAMPRRGRKPTVSTLPGASISIGTQAALLELRRVDVEPTGEYEFG
jgi:hypothetical protein